MFILIFPYHCSQFSFFLLFPDQFCGLKLMFSKVWHNYHFNGIVRAYQTNIITSITLGILGLAFLDFTIKRDHKRQLFFPLGPQWEVVEENLYLCQTQKYRILIPNSNIQKIAVALIKGNSRQLQATPGNSR